MRDFAACSNACGWPDDSGHRFGLVRPLIRLSTIDLTQIVRLSQEKAGTPWVIVGAPPPLLPVANWFVNVFIEPHHEAGGVRRGVMLTLIAALPARDAYDSPRTWRVHSVGEFAQVPVDASEPKVVANRRHLNRPFRVVGTIADEAILSIAQLVRTAPTVPPPASMAGRAVASIFTKVEGNWPIESMIVDDSSSVEVSLLEDLPNEKTGQSVEIRRAANTWVIERVGAYIRD